MPSPPVKKENVRGLLLIRLPHKGITAAQILAALERFDRMYGTPVPAVKEDTTALFGQVPFLYDLTGRKQRFSSPAEFCRREHEHFTPRVLHIFDDKIRVYQFVRRNAQEIRYSPKVLRQKPARIIFTGAHTFFT